MKIKDLSKLITANTKNIKELQESQKRINERLDRLGQGDDDIEGDHKERVGNFFYDSLSKDPELLGTRFNDVEFNILNSDGYERDIVLINKDATALISVKYKLHKKDVDKLISTELKRMQHFLEKLGSTHQLYAGVTSYIVNDTVHKYAEEKGLYVITRSGDNTVFLNKKGFQAKTF